MYNRWIAIWSFSAAFGMMFPEYFEEIMQKMRIVMRDKNPQMTSEQLIWLCQ